MIFLQRTREGHHRSDEHWNRFEGDIGETSERQGGAHMGLSKHTAKDITPSIAWRREARKEEALDDLP